MKFIIYSSLYGGYDQPKPPRPHPQVAEWRLYTDDPDIYAPGWKVIVEGSDLIREKVPMRDFGPRGMAKFRKCYLPRDADASLFLDASIRLFNPTLIDECAKKIKEGAQWCAYPHPERNTLREELAASDSPTWKYRNEALRMKMQVEAYERFFPEVDRLWAGGIVARRHTAETYAVSENWLAHCNLFSLQDQLSMPVVLKDGGITPVALTSGGGLWNNENFVVEPHRRLND